MAQETEDDCAPLGEELERIVKSHVAQLSEHFDSVQIVCTKQHEGGTIVVPYGEGNWFARYGSVKEWVVKREEAMRMELRQSDGN